ncbi:enhancer of mRNA-decapping protein 4 homolog isoform X1 [Anastrepha obliqua]|uniref:enhancer of mRNA-decapping protein 4 homolog isoform X1 n=2 Tax=Anastrepha obliqua TaxID=95512 RepID=UPI002409C45E|nr:enhancer of mRNA-decapping protein 4 homolog isoform X1 [Anastrepha obliqua]
MLISVVITIALIRSSLQRLRRRGCLNSDFAITGRTSEIKMSVNYMGQQQQTDVDNVGSSMLTSDALNGIGAVSSGSIITFKPDDNQCTHEITNNNVKVICSPGTHDHGSSKVKLKNIVDYKWELKNYPGHLIAVHMDGKHIAYVINVNNKLSRVEGMVRVVKAQTGLRALIKGMSGEVLDLQFAHIEKERILGSIDMNSLYIHKIDLVGNNLLCNLIVKIEDPLSSYSPKYDKISWCPFIDVPGEDDEDSELIAWARGSMLQCFNISVIVTEYGAGVIHPNDISTGYLKVYDELCTISWVALSPDGSTLGVGSTDGVIRFYQVYMHDKEPRCLHQWNPHNGKPISSFFFLDNLTKNVSETYWKYAITGAANNTEFKVWDCSTWECLQSLCITTATEEKKPLRFIAEIDRTSSYFVISSLDTRTCYIMQIVNNSNNTSLTKGSDNESNNNLANISISSNSSIGSFKSLSKNSPSLVYIKSISEFPLSSGILSFSIVDAAVRRYKCCNDNYLCDEFDDYDEETNSTYCVVVRMFIVQSKSMQECRILYQPSVTENTDVRSTLSDESGEVIASKDSSLLDSVVSCIGSGGSDIIKGGVIGIANSLNSNKLSHSHIKSEDVNEERVKQEKNSKTNSLESLLGIATAPSVSVANQMTVQTATISSSVVTVAATASAIPAAVSAELNDVRSRTASPQTSNKSFTQVNLMTPDAFSSTLSDKNTNDCVSSEVLNTILMLASVAGQTSAPKTETINILNLVNNKIIEDQEHQKLQLKQSLDPQKKFIAIENNIGRNLDNLASGGSSPSREVQEIMSLQEHDSGDDELLDKTATNIKVKVNNPPAAQMDEQGLDVSASTCHSTSSIPNWPKVPEMHKSATKHSTELQNAANLISQAVSASSGNNLNNSHVAPNLISTNSSSNGNLQGMGGGSNTEFSELNGKISQLIDLVKAQSMQINNLQAEVASMKKANPMASTKSMSEFSFKLEMQLSKLMEQYLKRYENEHKKKLAAFMAGRDQQNRELRESLIQILNQYILTHLGEVVSKVINMEIQRQLAPMLSAKIEHLQQQIQLDVAQKLTAFDLMLKENISQVCKSKNIIETFGKSVLVGVQGSLQAAFIESMSSTLIPAYEKSSQNMFKQLHDAFSVGIKEFMEQFDNYLQHLQPMQDSTEEVLNKFSGFRQHLDSILIKHRNSVTETMLETRKDVKSLEILLSRQIQETFRTEMRRCFENQTVALRSQTNTPAPMFDMKDTIKLLLHQNQINKAFHQALLANDLNLVEFTLKNADHATVFTPDCCLEQKVLLSLIQQISADMSNHNEVKQNYLADALLAINPMDPITREHAPKVLQELFRNCKMFLVSHSKSPQCSNVRMLMKAVQAYMDQF